MKKLYIFILLLIAGFSSRAQYTLTSAITPVVGDQSITWAADTSGIVVGPAGTNQIWNYLGVTVPSTVTAKTTSYVAVNTAPNYTAYPLATLANTSDGINYSMESYGTNLTSYGQTSSTLSIIYGNPITLLYFPFSYGMASSDTYSTTYVSGTSTITQNGTYTTTADGWGTLNMPGGKSYPNTLRIKLQGYSTGTFATGTVVTTFTQTSTNHIHIGAGSKFSIFEISTSVLTAKTGTIINVTKSKNVIVSDQIFLGIKENNTSANFSMYPNPTSSREVNLNFMLAENENYSATIFNALGQEVRSMCFGDFSPGKYSIKMDLHDLNCGLYYIKLKGNKRENVQKLIIE